MNKLNSGQPTQMPNLHRDDLNSSSCSNNSSSKLHVCENFLAFATNVCAILFYLSADNYQAKCSSVLENFPTVKNDPKALMSWIGME